MKRILCAIFALGLCLAPLTFAQEGVRAGGQEGEHAKEEKKSGIPEVNIAWVWANFAILAGLLGYTAVKKGGPFFDSRAAEIRKGIADAEKIKSDSDAQIAAINSKLGRLDSEIASLRETAGMERRAAERRLEEETQREIERIRVNAEAQIETTGKTERVALQRYAAQLALELAETKVRARMNPSTEDALVQAFVNGLGTERRARPETRN